MYSLGPISENSLGYFWVSLPAINILCHTHVIIFYIILQYEQYGLLIGWNICLLWCKFIIIIEPWNSWLKMRKNRNGPIVKGICIVIYLLSAYVVLIATTYLLGRWNSPFHSSRELHDWTVLNFMKPIVNITTRWSPWSRPSARSRAVAIASASSSWQRRGGRTSSTGSRRRGLKWKPR